MGRSTENSKEDQEYTSLLVLGSLEEEELKKQAREKDWGEEGLKGQK